jgi:hypothetical protein
MFTLFLLYGLIILVLIAGAFVIVYHILRYSLTEPLKYFGVVLFGLVFLCLLTINFFSFQSLESVNDLPKLEIGPLMNNSAPTLNPKQSNPW